MADQNDGRARPSMVGSTVRTCLAVGFLSLFAANWLTNGFDTRGLSRLASVAGRDLPDPLTTGSLERSAGATALDPCATPRRR